MANISFTGRLSQPVELRFTPNGKAVATLNVAENHSRKNPQTNQFEDTGTTWRKVSVWGKRGEALGDLQKGAVVLVQGREETREYEKKDGSKGYSLEVVADVVGVVPVAQQSQGGGFQQPPAQQPTPANDPWGKQAGGDYQWGDDSQEIAPF